MAMAPSDVELSSLLRDFDGLYQEYKDGMSEAAVIKSKLSTEVQKRESAQNLCAELERDKQRLLKVQGEILSQISHQIEYRAKYEILSNQFKSLEEQLKEKEKEHKIILTSVAEEHSNEVRKLQSEVRQVQDQMALKDVAMAQLEEEIAHFRSATEALKRSLEQTKIDTESKYWHNIDELQKQLQMEMQERHKVQEEMQRFENSSMVARMKYEEQLRESSSNRHADAFKQKIMRLRKENEELRRQLSRSS